MRTLVTGASGFLGGFCLESLDARPLDPRVDLRDLDQIVDAVAHSRPEAVIHLAAQSSVATSIANPANTLHVNVLGTFNLLQALDRSGFRGRVLFVSSGDCYGMVDPANLPVGEMQPLIPRNPYAVSKIAAESLCLQWCKARAFRIVIARPFNLIGPRQSANFVISDIGRQLSMIQSGQDAPHVTVGDCEISRDFTDVRDAVRAFALLLEHGQNGEAYNVCSGRERTIREIIDSYADILGFSLQIRQEGARMRRAEQRRMLGSFAKLRGHTGWEPSIPLRTSLVDIIQYWKHQEKK